MNFRHRMGILQEKGMKDIKARRVKNTTRTQSTESTKQGSKMLTESEPTTREPVWI